MPVSVAGRIAHQPAGYSRARRRYPWIAPGSTLFWRIVKLQHAMGSPLTKALIGAMAASGLPAPSWEVIKAFELSDVAQGLHRLLRKDPGRFGHNVDAVFARGTNLAASIGR